MENELIIQLRDNTRAQLAEIKTVESGLEYLNKIKAIEVYAKAQKKDAELQNMIAEQKIRTQRKLGQLIQEGQEKGEIREKGNLPGINHIERNVPGNDITIPKTLTELGIENRNDSSAWQKIAALPDKIFEQQINEAKNRELTTSSILFAAKEYEQQQRKENAEWGEDELLLLEKIKAGYTILINMDKHLQLLKYAEDKGIYERIDRATEWGNPFIMDEDGTREDVCHWFDQNYFPLKKSLHKKIQHLKGKVLGCHCYPKKCHGETLILYAEMNP
jgi:hypothetical protein